MFRFERLVTIIEKEKIQLIRSMHKNGILLEDIAKFHKSQYRRNTKINIIITWHYKSFAENLTKLFIYKNAYRKSGC